MIFFFFNFDHEKIEIVCKFAAIDYGRNEINLCAGKDAINNCDADKLIHNGSKCIQKIKRDRISPHFKRRHFISDWT